MKQGSPEWHRSRAGKVTASRVADCLGQGYNSRPKAGRIFLGLEESVSEDDEMAWERIEYGTENEPNGRWRYEVTTGNLVTEAGFSLHPHIPWIGASPDGLVGSDGCIEIKCPFAQEHYGDVPIPYIAQCQTVMEVFDRDWCDFMSWIPDEVRVWRIHRSKEFWQWAYPLLEEFWNFVKQGDVPKRFSRKPVFDGKMEIEKHDF